MRALVNNGLIIAVSLLVQLPLALAVAMMVAGRIAGAVWFRMIFFLPYVLADVGGGADLALHVRRRLRPRRRDHRRRSASSRIYLLGEQGLGVRPPS